MMFSGIMEHTGQMEALMSPIMKYVKRFAGLIAATVGASVLVNVFGGVSLRLRAFCVLQPVASGADGADGGIF